MTSSVNTIGNRTFVSGLASGLDTRALLDAGYQQRSQRADRLDVRIDQNSAKISAYRELQNLTQSLADSVGNLRRVYDVLGLESNSWDVRSGTLESSDASIDPLGVISVGIENGARTTNYDIRTIQKASAERVASSGAAGTFADRNAALGHSGAFDIGLAGEATVNISITNDMSLNDIVARINNSSSETNVSAEIISNGNTSRLLIRADETGKAIDYTVTSGDDMFEVLGITDAGGAYTDRVSTSRPAIVEFEGIQITNSSNDFTNVVDGVSFSVLSAQPGATISLEINNDTSTAKTAINDFIESYNALREFIIQNEQVNADGSIPEDAVLFSENTLEDLSSNLQDILGTNVSTAAGIETLRQIGITLDADNRLRVSDAATLDNALLNNFDSVRALFETQVSFDNPNIQVTRNNTDRDFNFSLDVTTSGCVITGVSADGDNAAFEISGNRLIGAEGTIYAGLTLTYIGGENATINVNITQGVADKMYQVSNRNANIVGGDIQTTIANLEELNTGFTEEATEIRGRADAWREREINRLAALEARIQAAEILIDQIKAVLDVQRGDD